MTGAAPIRHVHGDERDVSKALPLLLLPLLVLSGISLVAITAPTAQATNGVVKDLTFLLHSVNATETAKPIPGGGSTLTYFDTTLDFNDANVSVLVEGTQKVLQWFLVPALAGDFVVEGLTLRIWSNSSTGASSNAQVTVEIYEVNATNSTLVHSENVGSQTFPVTPTLMDWTANLAAPHGFSAGSSLELRMTVNPGALQGVWFHYDTPQVNSRVSLTGPDSLDVAAILMLDSSGNVSTRFDPDAANQTLSLQAQVTDPLGGYDIRWVNLTLTSPTGVVLLDNATMARLSGPPTSFESLFELTWNYTGQPLGLYEVRIWALDNNGYNHYFFFQQFAYDNYPDVAQAAFFIGGLPVFANVQVVDARSAVLVGARVDLLTAGFPIEQEVTDATGMVNLSMATGEYEFRVLWQGVMVASLMQDVQSNFTEAEPLTITTRVYYPVFQAEDSNGLPLAGASLLVVHPNGDKLGPFRTNEDGQVPLGQVPEGAYLVSAAWRGVAVFEGSMQVAGNGILAFRAAVHELTVAALDKDGQPLNGVFVTVRDSAGLVFDAGVTGADGTAVLLLPAGNYTVEAQYITSFMGSLYDSGMRSRQVELSGSTNVAVTFVDFPPALTGTFLFLFGLVYAASVIALLIGFLVLLRRKGSA
ncbi:MAG: hypothetical protein ACE5LS_01745 [Thermoplasmata archaeon]